MRSTILIKRFRHSKNHELCSQQLWVVCQLGCFDLMYYHFSDIYLFVIIFVGAGVVDEPRGLPRFC